MRPQVHEQRSRTIGLLAYLYGPGRRGEHTDPHLVASWDGFAPDSGRDPNATLKELADLLDLPVRRAGDKAPAKHVWHMSIRVAPEDRTLTDAEWGEAVRRIVRATGIDPGPDSDQPHCRWVAIRHDDNHVHIAATLAQSDGEAYHPWQEGKAAQKEARLIERDFGLRQLDQRDRTAARRPSKAEQYKAERTGRLARNQLQTLVRTAAAYAADPAEFLALLERLRLLVRPSLDETGTIRGYSVALHDNRNAAGEPVWFAGGTLAPDLSWPKIHARLTSDGDPADSGGTAGDPAAAQWPDLAAPNPWDRTSAHLDHITALLHATAASPGGDEEGAGTSQRTDSAAARAGQATRDEIAAAHRAAIGQLLDMLPVALRDHLLPTGTRQDLRHAANAFAHVARTSGRAAHAQTSAARRTFRALADTVLDNTRADAADVVVDLIATALLAVIAVAQWHQANKHEAQARAAAQAAHNLRNAYRATAPRALDRLVADHAPDDQLAAEYAKVTRDVLAKRTDATITAAVLADPAMAALTAAVHRGVERGHLPLVLLDQAVTQRELASADNPAEVLAWRVHRLTRTTPAAARRGNNPDNRRAGNRANPRTHQPVPQPTANPTTRRTR